MGPDLLAVSPPPGVLLGRRHCTDLGPAELGALPFRFQQGERYGTAVTPRPSTILASPPSPLLSPTEHGTPTSVAFVATDPNQVVVSFDGGETVLYDLTTEQSSTALETQTKDGTFRPEPAAADPTPDAQRIPPWSLQAAS